MDRVVADQETARAAGRVGRDREARDQVAAQEAVRRDLHDQTSKAIPLQISPRDPTLRPGLAGFIFQMRSERPAIAGGSDCISETIGRDARSYESLSHSLTLV